MVQSELNLFLMTWLVGTEDVPTYKFGVDRSRKGIPQMSMR